jgi:hypothetical protein
VVVVLIPVKWAALVVSVAVVMVDKTDKTEQLTEVAVAVVRHMTPTTLQVTAVLVS